MNIDQAKTVVSTILQKNKEAASNRDFASNIIPYMVSAPGIGKTSVVEELAEELGWDLITVPLASYDAAEIAGFPIPDKEQMIYNRATPFWLKATTSRPTILFFDELPQAPTPNLNVVAMLVNERKLGEHVLPDNVVIVLSLIHISEPTRPY